MGNTSQKVLELIETRLEVSESPLEKKISNEYHYLKKSQDTFFSPQKKSEHFENIFPTSNKIIYNHIKLKKRIERFTKWFTMIFPSEDQDVFRKSKSRLSSSANKSMGNSNKSDNFHNSNPRSIDNDSIIPKNSFSLFNLEGSFEKALRKYYENNKLHFAERVSKGPPDSLRWLSWMILLDIPEKVDEKFYRHLYTEEIDEKIDTQIKKDLNRTLNETINLSNNNIINQNKNENIDKEQSLYQVLRALANIDKELGYCQGVNFITGFLLNVADYNEVETFNMLIGLFSTTYDDNYNLRGFFIDNFPLLECYLYIFDKILENELPELRNHIKVLEIPQEAWISKWIQTLYTICLSNEYNIRIWDCIIATELYFIISFSISLIQIIEKDLLNIKDAFDFTEYFKNFFASSTYNNSTHIPPDKELRNVVILDDVIKTALKNHKNFKSKNIFINLKQEYTSRIKSLGHFKISYNINYHSSLVSFNHHNSNNNNNSNSNMTMTNFRSNFSEEENADSCCDEYEGNSCNSNIINLKQASNYVFMVKDKKGIYKK